METFQDTVSTQPLIVSGPFSLSWLEKTGMKLWFKLWYSKRLKHSLLSSSVLWWWSVTTCFWIFSWLFSLSSSPKMEKATRKKPPMMMLLEAQQMILASLNKLFLPKENKSLTIPLLWTLLIPILKKSLSRSSFSCNNSQTWTSMPSTNNKPKSKDRENLTKKSIKKPTIAIKITKDRNNHNKKMMEV